MNPEESESEIFKDITVLALKMEGAMSQRMWAASRNWKNRNGIPSWSPWEEGPAKALILAQ